MFTISDIKIDSVPFGGNFSFYRIGDDLYIKINNGEKDMWKPMIFPCIFILSGMFYFFSSSPEQFFPPERFIVFLAGILIPCLVLFMMWGLPRYWPEEFGGGSLKITNDSIFIFGSKIKIENIEKIKWSVRHRLFFILIETEGAVYEYPFQDREAMTGDPSRSALIALTRLLDDFVRRRREII